MLQASLPCSESGHRQRLSGRWDCVQDLIADETQDSAVKCVLCLGHNKGWEEAASSFSGRSVRLQPANAALLQGRGVSWQEALHGQAVLDLVELLLPYPAADTAPGTGLPTLA